MRNGVSRYTSDAEVIQLPQPATRGKREGTDGKCILATLSKNDRRVCRYSTDVVKYTLSASFTQIPDQVSRKRRPLRRTVSEGVHPTFGAHPLSAPHRCRT
ncbi:hypothetical protein DO71_5256 [Burkholderia pseudomallei]|nr:hypothetical protein DO71_5256 [Burkholderia pseudomallei]